AVDDDRHVLGAHLRRLDVCGHGHLEHQVGVLPWVAVHGRARLPHGSRRLDVDDEIARAGRVARSADAHVTGIDALHRHRMAARVDPRDDVRVSDVRHDVALAPAQREPVLQEVPHAREALAEADLDALRLARLDGEDAEGEAAIPDLLEQSRIAPAPRDVIVAVARGLLLEYLADDLVLAVPVGEAFHRGARGAQHVATFEATLGEVFELLLEHRAGVLVVDLDAHALGDGAQMRADPIDAALEQ